VYRVDVRDKVGLADAGEDAAARGYTYEWQNVDDAFVQGIELDARYEFTRTLAVEGHATVARGEYENERDDWAGTEYEEDGMTEHPRSAEGERRICSVEEARTFDHPLRFLLHQPGRMLGPYVKPGDTVLDFGCGLGFFSKGLAKLVGKAGRVIAADVQQEMLDAMMARVRRTGLADRITPHLTTSGPIPGPVDFALACWVVHETPDIGKTLQRLADALKPGGRLYVLEPVMHVSENEFEDTLRAAGAAGLREIERPRSPLSRAVVFERSAERR